ncbi:hypothetical protein ACWDUD_05935 [Rhodococcus sp. NPDC003382]
MNITTATAANAAGTVSVRTTDQGVPVELHIDPRELRHGAGHLAGQILALSRRATLEAAALRRGELAAQGMPDALLDRMGLPTRDEVARVQQADDEQRQPTSWLRSV